MSNFSLINPLYKINISLYHFFFICDAKNSQSQKKYK